MKKMTGNQMAVRILINGKPRAQQERELAVLRAALTDAMNGVCECPNCGRRDRHDDNGCAATSIDFTILCTACGEQWCPNV
jgi:hypothetical protein